jgi:glutathione S-transferase
MLKIFASSMSTCTRKVLMTLAETNTPYELSAIDFAKAEHKAEPHLSRQPFGQIPTIDDDGFTMYESRAICRYLNEKHAGKLVPNDAQSRARMEQWMSIETSNFTPHAMKFIYHYAFKRPQDAAVLETAGKALETAFGVLEARLATSPYLAGDMFSLADVCFMPYLEYAMASPVKEMLTKYPHVSAWWSKISERPTWLKVANRAA